MCRFVDTSRRKWRHKCRDRPEKHELTSFDRRVFCGRMWAVVHGLIRSGDRLMSSMWRAAVILPVLLVTGGVEPRRNMPRQRRPMRLLSLRRRPDVGYAIDDWRRLRQSSGYSFADYARFLIANPGWPDETQAAPLGRAGDAARAKIRRRSSPSSPPTSRRPATAGRGSPTAYAASGRTAEALDAARKAWASGDLSADRRASDLGALRRAASPPPTMTAGPTPCCSPRRPTMRPASIR